MSRKGEWILWGAAALLLLAVCAAAVAGAPDFAPVTVTYSAASEPPVSPSSAARPAPAAVGRGDFLPKYRGIVFGQYAGAA